MRSRSDFIKSIEQDLLLHRNWTRGDVQTTNYFRLAWKNALWILPFALFFLAILYSLIQLVVNKGFTDGTVILLYIVLLSLTFEFVWNQEDGSIRRFLRNIQLFWQHVRSRIELNQVSYRSGNEVTMLLTSSQSRNTTIIYNVALNYIHEVEVEIKVKGKEVRRIERKLIHTVPLAIVSAPELAKGIRFTLPLEVNGKSLLTRMSKSPGAKYWEVLVTQPHGKFYARAVLEVS